MIIFDLDGTLANCEHRRHLINPDEYPHICEYSNYYIDATGDTVIDLDGKASWRYKKTGKPFQSGWSEFYEACDKDEPIQPVIDILNYICYCERDKIEIWSSRCESVKEKTVKWLSKHTNFPLCNELKMRPIGDNSTIEWLKESWYLDLKILTNKNINFVFDSHPQSVKMWKRRGVFVFNCTQTDKEL